MSTEKLGERPKRSCSKKSSSIKTLTALESTKQSNKTSSRSKIGKISKTTGKIGESNFLKSLMNLKSIVTEKTLVSGIKTHYASSLTIRKENNVEYSIFPWYKGRCSGFIKMQPLGEKLRSRTSSKMVCEPYSEYS